MPVVSKGEFTVSRLDDGVSSYLHTAWKMSDGTFLNGYPGENLILKSDFKSGLAGWGNSGLALSVYTSDDKPEGTSNNSLKIVVNGTTWQSGVRYRIPGGVKANAPYTVSFWAKSSVNGTTISCESAGSLRLNSTLSTEWQFFAGPVNFQTDNGQLHIYKNGPVGVTGEEAVYINSIMLSKGETEIPLGKWWPAPSEDYSLAYPKYRGEYTDTVEADSTDPNRYTWTAYLGEQGPPTGVISQNTVPSSPYIGMLWQCTGNIDGYINPATYRWNGSSWEIYQFTAHNIMADTFTGFVFRGVEFIGSKFVSEFRYSIGDGQYYYADGTTTIENGSIVTDLIEHYPTDPEEYDESFSRHIELSPQNALYMKLKGLRSDLSQEIQLSPGGLMLKANELMATLTVENIYSLVRPARRNTSPADDTNRKGVVVNYFRVGNLVNVAVKFELLKDTGWIALAPMPPSGYAPASMYQASGVAGSISYRGQTCMVYCNKDGLRLIPTTGQGTGVFQLSLTWTTNDPFPYGDS